MNRSKSVHIKERESNMELLRIISMVFVLVSHASYTSLGSPTQTDISTSLDSVFLRALSESFSKVCVNAFILISGWYGIRVRRIRFAELISQVLFISIILYFVMRSLGLTRIISMNEWIDLLLFKHLGYWFVRAYIILYLFAPILNKFVENVDKNKLMTFLIAFYSVQFVYGFYHYGGWYAGGYSPLSFIGLYFIARYMRLYPNKYTQFNKFIDLLLYVIISVFTVICSLSLAYFLGKGGMVLFLYSSPLVILSSVFFFLFFTKLSFQSQFINWISVSCFSVYLVHTSPYIFKNYYIDVIRYWYEIESRIPFILYTSGLIAFFFVFSVCFDKVRIIVWNSFLNLYKHCK